MSNNNKRRRWTNEEFATLRKMHADGHTILEMAQAVNRTSGAVEFRINAMGLSKAGRTGRNPQVRVPPEQRKRRGPTEEVKELAMSKPWR